MVQFTGWEVHFEEWVPLTNLKIIPNVSLWKQIWKFPAHENVKFLCWLMAKKAIPLNEWRCFRGIASSQICSRCSSTNGNWFHVFFACQQNPQVWNAEYNAQNTDLDQTAMLQWLCKCVGIGGPHFLATLWAI